VPVLGICYGQQAMVHHLGGKVEPHHKREFGRAEIEVTGQSKLFDGVWPLGTRDDFDRKSYVNFGSVGPGRNPFQSGGNPLTVRVSVRFDASRLPSLRISVQLQ